ncbi:MAG: DUF192 domain-containing protein [Treponemataceae bacterium]|nr:DUF192 domain-containing protein [Treponemataceae bacterium]
MIYDQPRQYGWSWVYLLILVGGFWACTEKGAQKGLPERDLVIQKANGGTVVVRVEIADTEERRNRGLMFRQHLPNGRGMWFVFEGDQILSFWMKNTLVPLSIAYVRSDGTIVDILPMVPGDLGPIQSSRAVRYALEVPRGWFEKEGIQVGDRVVLP